MASLGWDECDVIIVTGDAFVDHPSFGSAVICRVLLDAGFRVGVISQPDWASAEAFTALGRPRLCFGVTGGNVDSLVANLSPNLQRRRSDDHSPGGKPGLRPDRGVTVYSNLVRQAYKDVPLVIGGIEASLRRLAHYDHWTDSVRRSVLLDTRADILVYGMGEKAMLEICRRLAAAKRAERVPETLTGIPGTAVNLPRSALPAQSRAVLLPSFETVSTDKSAFSDAFRRWHYVAADPHGKPVAQPHGDRVVVQYPPPQPLSQAELDHIYDLPYTRRPHRSYESPIPALDTVKFSITSHRGCLGSCSFCSLAAHQGRIIQWRSFDSILREAKAIARLPDFKGHITDIGGPTANMYRATCPQMKRGRICPERECTFPRKCVGLDLDLDAELRVLEAVRRLPGVKQVSVGSGIRFDLLDDEAGGVYLDQLCRFYISGQLRTAPEHVAARVLAAMHKAPADSYARFRRRFARTNERLGKKQYLIPYFISGHPGATIDDAVELAEYLVREERLFIRQVQQFTPLPLTAAGVAWHTGKDPLTGKPLHVARDPAEMKLQRSLLQLHEPRNYEYACAALEKLGRRDLVRRIHALKPLLSRWLGRKTSPRRERHASPSAGPE